MRARTRALGTGARDERVDAGTMSGRHKYEKDRSYQAYQREFEEFNSRFNGKTEIKKLSFEELEIDRQKMDKLIGYSSPPKKKLNKRL